MTVIELIALLAKTPPDAKVYVTCGYDGADECTEVTVIDSSEADPKQPKVVALS